MMFFMLSVYYVQKWYYQYAGDGNIWMQYRTIIKCALVISAASLTRYEGWVLPFGLLIVILLIFFVVKREKRWSHRIEAILIAALPFSLSGIVSWVAWNLVIFRNPTYFSSGPFSAQTQALSRPYRQHLYLQPLNSLYVMFNIATAMYGILVPLVSLIGIIAYLYMNRGRLFFSLLTILMLMTPFVFDYIALVQGSGEMGGEMNTASGWFNARYLIFLAPLFAFASVSLVMFVAKKRRKAISISTILLILVSYCIPLQDQTFDLDKAVALKDRGLIPFQAHHTMAFDAGKSLGKLYEGGDIVSFTSTQYSDEIMYFSGIPLRNFIDISAGEKWDVSEKTPWTYGKYIIIEKKAIVNYDPTRDTIEYWLNNIDRLTTDWIPVNDRTLIPPYDVIYENEYYQILKQKDDRLVAKMIASGIEFPTSMAFLGPNDILVLEKNEGTVKRIVNGTVMKEPLLDVDVAIENERGLVGIAVAKNEDGPINVFLYYNEAESKDGEDVEDDKEPLGARLYKYELVDNKLVNPVLLIDTADRPISRVGHYKLPEHYGGKMTIGPDNNLYLVVGDVVDHSTQTQNINGSPANGTSVIYRITQDGKPVGNILGNGDPLNKYFAYGIRNSFGLDFDPVTGKLWDTENGPGFGDEINLVEPGFNSGWKKVQGLWEAKNYTGGPLLKNFTKDYFTTFNGNGTYSSPEFTWNQTVGVTAIKFLDSDKLGKQYENDLFVGDINFGNLYHFDLNQNRTELMLNDSLRDRVANNSSELEPIIFGKFGGITDIQVGPDGNLYISSISSYFEKENDGVIYRIERSQ